MAAELNGRRVAILVTDGFERVELVEPKRALEEAGADVDIVAPHKQVQAWNHDDKAELMDADVELAEVDADDYDALMLPGGAKNPDRLRTNEEAVRFVRSFFDHSKPVAAICHAAWTLIEAGVVQGRTMTSWPSLKTDLRNAGASWVDQEVVRDKNLVTSRKPDDLTAFNHAMIAEFAAGTSAALHADAAE